MNNEKQKQTVFGLNGKIICDADFRGNGWQLTFKAPECYTLLNLYVNGEMFVTGFTMGENSEPVSEDEINSFNEVLEGISESEEEHE